MNNKVKTQLQQREFIALKDQYRVILKWATGCGKSKMTIDLINHQCRTLSYPTKVLFVVAERAHINNWQDEFNKWHLDINKVATDVCCYASLKKYKDFHYNIVVLDEGHHCFSEKRMAALEELKENLYPNAHIYLLSATLSSSKIAAIEEIFGRFTVSSITLKDAIQSDILPDPKVYVVAMELDDRRPNQTIEARKGDNPIVVDWANRNKYKFKGVPYTIRCTQKEKNLWFTNEMEYWKQRYENSHNSYHHNNWKNLGSQRKRFLGELKTEAVYRLIQRIPKGKRFVCFCASVKQAGILSSDKTISSRKSSKYNQRVIDNFNSGFINSIYAVGMITEGMNLNRIDMGIITQLDGKERLFIQKFGRALRAEDPVAFIFYFKNTQDEVYLKNVLENVDAKYVQHITINQLNNVKL